MSSQKQAAGNPYEILGVPRDADDQQIKKAFRKLARELHPDVNAHDPEAEEKFKAAAEAYEILSDSKRRATYDQYGHEGLRGGGQAPNFSDFGSISDLFNAFFGAGGSFGGFTDEAHVQTRLDLTLAQALADYEAELSYKAVRRCETCHGNRAEPGTPIITCERCGGQGQLQAVTRTPFGQMARTVVCDSCGGDGKQPQTPCKACLGEGFTQKKQSVSVRVPAGVEDGQQIRVSGHGHELPGGVGDLYVQVHVKADERYMRDGDDLVTVVDVPAPFAALGHTIDLETLDGEKMQLEIPVASQPGDIITVAGKGMPRLRRPGTNGKLRAVVNVVVPRNLTEKQRELYAEIAKSLEDQQLHQNDTLRDKVKRLFRR